MPNINNLQILKGLVLILILIGAGYFVYDLYQDSDKEYVTVVGTYSEDQQNNVAAFNLYLSYKNSDKQEAVSQLETQTEEVLAALEEFGIAEKDIQTTSSNVFREEMWDPNTNRNVEGDWVASTNINVKVLDAETVSEFTNVLTGLDLKSFDGPYFDVERKTVNESVLLEKAYEDAVKKAQMLTQAQGKEIVKAVEIVEGSAGSGVMPMARMEGLGGGGGIPVVPGTSEISKSLIVKFLVE